MYIWLGEHRIFLAVQTKAYLCTATLPVEWKRQTLCLTFLTKTKHQSEEATFYNGIFALASSATLNLLFLFYCFLITNNCEEVNSVRSSRIPSRIRDDTLEGSQLPSPKEFVIAPFNQLTLNSYHLHVKSLHGEMKWACSTEIIVLFEPVLRKTIKWHEWTRVTPGDHTIGNCKLSLLKRTSTGTK